MIDNEPFERRVGQRLKNKWTLERLLGVGGMAAVYVGVNTLGRREAIKILHPEVAANRDLRERFTEEGRAVNRFRHPGAVVISDIDVSEDGQPFLVMELLEGGSLADLLRRGHVPSLDTLLRLADELLDVLVAAHAVGIIHRDIKPDNLFVQSDGKLKVLDFGIARVRTEGPPTRGPTRTGVTIGTVAYMPPEQVMGRSDIDARVDIFAVGATLFRVLTGRSLHEAESQFEMMVKAASDPAPALSAVAPGVPADVALVVDRALAFDRSQRYPDARTMQDDVRSLRRHERPPYATSLLGAAMSPSQMIGPTSYGGSTAYTPTQSFQEPPRSSGHTPASAVTAATNPGPASYAAPPASMAFAAPAPPAAPPASAPYAAPPASAPYAAPPASAPAVPPLVPSPPGSHAGLIPPVGGAQRSDRKKLSAPLLGLGALMVLVVFGGLFAVVRGLGASETPAAPVSGSAGSGGSADDAGAPDASVPASTATTPGKVATATPGNGSPPAATNLGMPFPVRVVPGNIDAPPAEKDKKDKKKKGK